MDNFDFALDPNPSCNAASIRGDAEVPEPIGDSSSRIRGMRKMPFVLIPLFALLSGACSSVQTHYDFDPAIDFSNWGTYAWYPGESPNSSDPSLDNPLLHDRVEAAVDRMLVAKGFSLAKGSSLAKDSTPDFYVKYHLSTEQKLDIQTMNTGYRSGPYGGGWRGAGWGGPAWTETTVDQYEEGTLIIDFVDATARKLAWRGSGTRRLSKNPDPDQVTKRVDEAVQEILGQFPPGENE